jgi:hypothetical protein
MVPWYGFSLIRVVILPAALGEKLRSCTLFPIRDAFAVLFSIYVSKIRIQVTTYKPLLPMLSW